MAVGSPLCDLLPRQLSAPYKWVSGRRYDLGVHIIDMVLLFKPVAAVVVLQVVEVFVKGRHS